MSTLHCTLAPDQPVIALATYNGERFLEQTVSSLMNQDLSLPLVARDDCSNDGTFGLLNALAGKYPDRLFIMPPSKMNLGPVGNFSALLRAVGPRRVFLADQDDVWLPHKTAVLLDLMDRLEARHGASTPTMVFSDSRIVDHKLQPISESFWKLLGVAPPGALRLQRLVWGNFVQGCTMLCNPALLKVALPIPREAVMHDWWLLLCAVSLGRVDYTRERLVLYRDHTKNVIGAPPGLLERIARCFSIARFQVIRRELERSAAQCGALALRVSGNSDQKTSQFFLNHAATQDMPPFLRKAACLRLGLRMANPLGTILAYVAL